MDQAAIDHFDLERYIQTKGARQVSAGEWILDCPRCGKPKLAVNTTSKAWHCWTCLRKVFVALLGKTITAEGGGGLVSLISWIEGISQEDARAWVQSCYQDSKSLTLIGLDIQDRTPQAAMRRCLPLEFPEGIGPVPPDLPYLAERGISAEDVRLRGLCYGYTGKYAGRLFFPVWEDGQLMYWQARATWHKEVQVGRYVKTLNPPKQLYQATAVDLLYGLELVDPRFEVVITEGPMDAIRVGTNAVATMGKKISPAQIAKLIKKGVSAVALCWDGPSRTEPRGAWPEMQFVAPMLAQFFAVRMVYLPAGDPADYDRETVLDIIARAQCYSGYPGATRL